jgi:hypothetical protein
MQYNQWNSLRQIVHNSETDNYWYNGSGFKTKKEEDAGSANQVRIYTMYSGNNIILQEKYIGSTQTTSLCCGASWFSTFWTSFVALSMPSCAKERILPHPLVRAHFPAAICLNAGLLPRFVTPQSVLAYTHLILAPGSDSGACPYTLIELLGSKRRGQGPWSANTGSMKTPR